MKRITRKTTRYQCDRCKTTYKTRAEALKCDETPVEDKAFAIGDNVVCDQKRRCSTFFVHNRYYSIAGKITGIQGPILPDEEYNNKWLGGVLAKKHVYLYETSWICPRCRQECHGIFYGIELKKV